MRAGRSAYATTVPDPSDKIDHDAETIDPDSSLEFDPPSVRQPATPERIGKYTIKRELASGAMGTVYIAVQDTPRRTVALKMMKRGVTSKSALRRFEFESQILARLRHPNIAQVFEAGTHDDGHGGVPYFAMEYIPNAKTVIEFVALKRLSTRQRLELFVKICDAVHHGHQKGIIHRDLKPGNILVDSTGEPRIIDFGVARSTDSDLAVTTLQTDVGQLVGTLQYMSPEQCDADPHDLDTRSDVYALGVVLYEILCDQLPYDVSRVTIYEASQLIRECAPLRPSSIKKTLRGDVETITLKAMEKNRERRYQSAAELSRDIRRYLANEPIEGRPPSVVYQLHMFARRHSVLFAAATTVGAVLVVATIISIVFAARASVAEKAATESSREAIHQRDLAVAAESQARAAKAESDRQRDAALAAETHAQTQSYVLQVAAASAAITNGALDIARRRLDNAPAHLRNWEWHHLSILADKALDTLRGGEGRVSAVAFGPHGKRLAAGSTDGLVTVWDVATGRALARLLGHEDAIYAVAFAPQSTLLASSSADMTIRIWDAVQGTQLRALRGHDGVVTSLAFSPDGRRLASGSSDTTVRMWDVATGAATGTLVAADGAVDCLAWSPDGSILATGSGDKSITLWDPASGRQLRTLSGHGSFITSLAFSPDGSRLASGSADTTSRIWNVSTGVLELTLASDQYVSSVAFSTDGALLASGSENNTIRLWSTTSGEEVSRLRGHEGPVSCVAFSPDGLRLVSGSEDETVKLWDAAARDEILSSPAEIASRRPGTCAAFGPDGRIIAAVGWDRTIRLLDATTGAPLAVLAGHKGEIASIAFSPDGRRLASASDDTTIKLWDVDTGRELGTLRGHERLVTAVDFSADGLHLASGSWDGTIRLWDVATGRTVDTMRLPQGSVNAVAFDPNGGRLASGSTRGTVHLWSTVTGEAEAELPGHDGPVYAIAFDPDGRRLATGGADQLVRIWDTDTLQLIGTLRGHEYAVNAVVFSPDGSRLVTGSTDRTIRIWDPVAQEQLAVLHGHRREVASVAFSFDGTRIVSSSLTRTVRVWDSVSPRDRFQLRAKVNLAAAPGRALVDRLIAEGLGPAQVVARLRGDPSLARLVRRAALNEALHRFQE